MQGTVKWVDEVMFVGESGSGHSVVMDGPIELGGRNHGLRPMEMLLLGTGGCALFDVVTMLKSRVRTSRTVESNYRPNAQTQCLPCSLR